MDETDLQMLSVAIQHITWWNWPTECSINSRHELIKSETVRIGRELGYRAIPEVYAYEGSDNSRIDVVWYNSGRPVVAIEIDGTVKNSSVEKLEHFSQNGADPVIISKSPNESRIREKIDEKLPDDFYHVDAELHEYF